MSLTQFKGLDIYTYKFINHQNKINIFLIQVNKFDVS
jgi:hypothetical protein